MHLMPSLPLSLYFIQFLFFLEKKNIYYKIDKNYYLDVYSSNFDNDFRSTVIL